jgi:hypothetical protein
MGLLTGTADRDLADGADGGFERLRDQHLIESDRISASQAFGCGEHGHLHRVRPL